MDVATILRYFGLAVCLAAMGVGVLVCFGFLVSPAIPENFRIVLGAVVFLYGAYRFVIILYRAKLTREED